MIIELIGPSGAGKSTLARMVCDRLGGREHATVAPDLVLDRPGLRRIHNATAANIVQDVCGLPFLAGALPECADTLRLSAGLLREHAPSRFDHFMNARSVLRRIGMFELARARAAGRVVLVDEGPLLIAYHLFVYSTVALERAPVERFAATVPLPDRVIRIRTPFDVLAERAFSRPDRRRQLAGMTPEEAEVPLRRASLVFDRLLAAPRLRERTLVVDNPSRDLGELDRLARRLAGTVASWQQGEQAGPAVLSAGALP